MIPVVPPYIGRCIYCPRTDSLTKEHIIPIGLEGRQSLLAASCPAHRDITSAVETVCVEHLVSHARVELDVYGRRPNRKMRKAYGKQSVPMFFTFAFLHDPGIFTGAEAHDDIAARILIKPLNGLGRRLVEGKGKLEVSFKGGMRAKTFARLLAKIGHAYAVWKLSINGFTPMAMRLIEGKSPMDTTLLVGNGQHLQPPNPSDRHAMDHEWRTAPDGSEVLVVYIRLFSNILGTPTHAVVVGRRPAVVAAN